MTRRRSESLFLGVLRRCTSLLVCGVVVAYPTAQSPAPQVTVIRGGTIIDGTGGPPRSNVDILVRGDRIDALGPGLERPAGATVIDASGKYVLPGLWDAHVHYEDWMPELLITHGVTSIWNQGAGSGPWTRIQHENVIKGKILGPRNFYDEQRIGTFGGPDVTADDARKQVRELAKGASRWVHLHTRIPPDMLRVVADEAHGLGLIVAGHIGMGAREAALAGIDGLFVSTGLDVDVVKPDVLAEVPKWLVLDSERFGISPPSVKAWDESTRWGPNKDLIEFPYFIIDPRRQMMWGKMDRSLAHDLIDLLIKENVFIETAPGEIFRSIPERSREHESEDHLLLNDPNLHYIPDAFRRNMLDYSLRDKLAPHELKLAREGYRNYLWFLKTFADRGGKLTIGTNASNARRITAIPGVSLQREMQQLVEDGGLSPMQAIQAATVWPATVSGKTPDLGTLEKGKLADLIVVARNPLEDITALKAIDMVMQGGKMLKRGYHYYFVNPIPWPDIEPAGQTPARLTAISPQVVVEGSGEFVLTVTGREFISSAVVKFGDRLLETRVVSPTELAATVPAGLIQSVGTHRIRVVHRFPGYGETNTANLIVTFK